MDMRTFLKTTSKTERERVAKEAETTVAYLFQLAGGHREPSVKLAMRLEKASGGLLSRRDLRPDIFRDIHQENVA
ncbi:MAG: hypothetical protein IBX56_14245 [Methylomicrobium sp.]|nr:hypothetical protein [Methylomicrobium sp.]